MIGLGTSARVRAALLALVLVGSPAAAGCGASADSPPSARSSSTTTSAPTASDDPAASPSESATPATGREVDFDQFSVHLPRGWRIANDAAGFFVSATDPAGLSLVGLSAIDRDQAPLDTLAREALRHGSWLRKPARVEDATVAGVDVYHLSGPVGPGQHAEVYGAWRGGSHVSVELELRMGAAERRRVVDSVLASWEWR